MFSGSSPLGALVLMLRIVPLRKVAARSTTRKQRTQLNVLRSPKEAMDIWEWVEDLETSLNESGEGELADALFALPAAATAGDDEALDLADKLLVAAEELNNPWLGVYARRHKLQYLIGSRGNAQEVLDQALAARESARSSATAHCPQTVCLATDVSFAYDKIDPVGYGPEREAVCREALLEINPEWNWYGALSRELAKSLADQGLVTEAASLLQSSIEEIVDAGRKPTTSFLATSARVANLAGNHDQALAICTEGEGKEFESDRNRALRRLEQARALRSLGRAEEALKVLPVPDAVRLERGVASAWTEELFALVREGATPNTPSMGSALQSLLDEAVATGALRSVITIGRVHGILAAERGAGWMAEAAEADMEEALAFLPADHGATNAIAEVRAAREGVTDPELPCEAGELLVKLDELGLAPELAVAHIRTALEELPDDPNLAMSLGEAYRASGATRMQIEHSTALADHVVALHPSFRMIVQSLLASNASPAQVKDTVSEIGGRLQAKGTPAHEVAAHRLVAEHAWRTGDAETTLAATEAAVGIADGDAQLQHLAGLSRLRLDDYEGSLAHFKRVDEIEAGACDWELVMAGSCVGDWDTVRAAAARLELEIPEGDGEIRGNFGICRAVVGPRSAGRVMLVQRTGPVMGKVIEVSHPDHDTQLFGTDVVFNPNALNLKDREEQGEGWVPIFEAVKQTREDSFVTHVIDGAAPGEENWTQIQKDLRPQGWGLWLAPWPDYTVDDPANPGGKLQGMYIFIAAPAELSAEQIDEQLQVATADWPHPMTWPTLVPELSEERQEYHGQIQETYGITL